MSIKSYALNPLPQWRRPDQSFGLHIFAFDEENYMSLNELLSNHLKDIRSFQISLGWKYLLIKDVNQYLYVFTLGSSTNINTGYSDKFLYYKSNFTNIKTKYISSGHSNHAAFIDTHNNIFGFGENYAGQLIGQANNYNNIIKLPIKITDIKAIKVSVGLYHTLFIDVNNTVWSRGNNEYGQLGAGDYNDRYVFTQILDPVTNQAIIAKDVIAGSFSSFIIDQYDNVLVFGANFDNINVPIKLPNIKAKDISTWDNNTMILDLENNVWIFGDNNLYQLGTGNNIPIQSPLKLNIKAKKISMGQDFSAIIDMDNNVLIAGRVNDDSNIIYNTHTIIEDFKGIDISAGSEMMLVNGYIHHK